MRANILLVCTFVFLLFSIPCFSQGVGTNAGCNLAGTWYGGDPDTAPFPYYRLNITPISADHFSITAQLVLEIQSVGYLNATDWTGDLYRSGPHSWNGMMIQMLQFNPASAPEGVDASLPEVDFIHIQKVEFLDCNTFGISYDVVAVYFNALYTNMSDPMVTPPNPPGFVFDPMLTEVYHRIPSSVSDSVFASAAKSAGGPQRKR